jgi:hypothetical protein
MFGALVCCGLLVGYFFFFGAMVYTMEHAADAQLRGTLNQACEAYRVKHGRFPVKLEVLLEKDEMGRPYLDLDSKDALIDPWGQPYQYDAKGPRNNGVKPDIWTVTPAGVEIGNWPGKR